MPYKKGSYLAALCIIYDTITSPCITTEELLDRKVAAPV
jgi:hypothetical protein